jgi:hypothetical protein
MELLECIENRLTCAWKRERQTPSERVRRETRKDGFGSPRFRILRRSSGEISGDC